MGATPPCIPFSNAFQLSDFQGHILAVANTNPVTSIRPNGNPGPPTQQWSFFQSTMGFTGTLVSGADQDPLGPVLAWNTQWYDIPQNLIGAQPIIASNTQCTALQLQITCLGPTVANIVEYITGAALTSWPAQPGDTNNPVTFETFDQRVQQNWTIIPLASLD